MMKIALKTLTSIKKTSSIKLNTITVKRFTMGIKVCKCQCYTNHILAGCGGISAIIAKGSAQPTLCLNHLNDLFDILTYISQSVIL